MSEQITALVEAVAEAADVRVDAQRHSTEAFDRASAKLDAAQEAVIAYVATLQEQLAEARKERDELKAAFALYQIGPCDEHGKTLHYDGFCIRCVEKAESKKFATATT